MDFKISYNQLANAKNPHQGKAVKALCVCSAGLLRSPSIAKYLTEKGYNTRACGTSQEYALIPLSPALLTWADEIHVVAEQYATVQNCLKLVREKAEHTAFTTKVYSYNIPDQYGTFTPALMKEIAKEYKKVNL
jgi:predicted protein tyrosine phosphatase